MARQKVILLHTSGTSSTPLTGSGDVALALGEIAVQHNYQKPELLIRLSDSAGAISGNLAHFVDSAEINARISSASTELSTAIGNLDTRLGDGVTAASSATAQFTAVGNRLDAIGTRLAAAEDDITGLTTSAQTIADNLTAETSARTAADTALGGRIDGVVSSIDTINGEIGTEFTSDSTIPSQLAAVKSTADSAVQTINVAPASNSVVTLSKGVTGTTVEITATVDVDNVSGATSASTGLSQAWETKQYVDAAIQDVIGGGSGESLSTLRTDIDAISGTNK